MLSRWKVKVMNVSTQQYSPSRRSAAHNPESAHQRRVCVVAYPDSHLKQRVTDLFSLSAFPQSCLSENFLLPRSYIIVPARLGAPNPSPHKIPPHSSHCLARTFPSPRSPGTSVIWPLGSRLCAQHWINSHWT